MSGPWSAHSWRLGMSLQQLRREVRELARDWAAVTACRARRRHFIEPDHCAVELLRTVGLEELAAVGPPHMWCSSCGWCESERTRRADLVGVPCGELEQLVLP